MADDNPDVLVVNLGAAAWQGAPTFTLTIDGQAVAQKQAVAAQAPSTQSFSFRGNWPSGTHTASLVLDNPTDPRTPGRERALFVSSAVINSTPVAGVAAVLVDGTGFEFSFPGDNATVSGSTSSAPAAYTIGQAQTDVEDLQKRVSALEGSTPAPTGTGSTGAGSGGTPASGGTGSGTSSGSTGSGSTSGSGTPAGGTPTKTPPPGGFTNIGLDPAFYAPVTTGDMSPNGWMFDGNHPVPGNTWGSAASADITPANEYRCFQAIGDKGVLNYVPPGPFQFGLEVGGNIGFTSVTVQAKNPVWPPKVTFNAVQQVWGKAAFIGAGAFDANGNEMFPCDVTVRGIMFTNNGNKNSPSSGDGAVYGEAYCRLFVDLCGFEGNKDAIFTNLKCRELHVSRSALSIKQGNGAGDGKSHDTYTSARYNTFQQVITGGLSSGNSLKFRKEQPVLDGKTYDVVVDQSLISSGSGYALDMCWGGQALVANSVIVQPPGSSSGNMLGLDEELSNPANPTTVTIRNSLIIITRYGAQVLMRPGTSLIFDNCLFWIIQTDNLAPSFQILTAFGGNPGGPCNVTGLPFDTKNDGLGNLALQIPQSAILGKSKFPTLPTDPTKLADFLGKVLPAPIAPVTI